MRMAQFHTSDVAAVGGLALPADADLLLVFGARALLQSESLFPALRTACPDAVIAGCSTAGEICGTEVHDDSLVITAVNFVATRVALISATLEQAADSRQAGATLSAACSSVAETSATRVAAGPVESRYGAEGEGPSIYLTDPEGNVVELKGPPASGWRGGGPADRTARGR